MADETMPDLVDATEASRLLEVGLAQVQVMVDEGMLTPVAGQREQRFLRSEVLALREAGG